MRSPASETSKVALARVTRPVGLKGGVRIDLLCDGPDRLREVEQTFLGPDPTDVRPAVMDTIAERGKDVVVFFRDCTTRAEAEKLRGWFIFIDESESLPSPDGIPRIHELEGCAVHDQSGIRRGTVESIYDVRGARMLGVRMADDGREILVPFVDAWIARFDPVRKRIDLTSDELLTEL